MIRKNTSLAKWIRVALFVLIVVGIITTSAIAEVSDIENVMITPNELDSGYWVNAYQDYLNSNSGLYKYVALVDLDLDGIPGMVAVKEIEKTWYIIADMVCIDRNGSLQVTEYDELQMDTVISLYIGDDGPMCVRKEEFDYKGTAAAANLYALDMNIFYNVERYGTEEEIREEITYSAGWENSDMYFSNDNGYAVTINLGVMPDDEWDGQIWRGD